MDENFSMPPVKDVALQHNDTDTFEQVHREAALDEALRCTFPASDPVALFSPLVMAESEEHRRITGLFLYPPLRKHS